MSPADRDPELSDLAASPGLCASCTHRRLVASRRSTFLHCALSQHDARFPRYPPLPVTACEGYRPEESAALQDDLSAGDT